MTYYLKTKHHVVFFKLKASLLGRYAQWAIKKKLTLKYGSLNGAPWNGLRPK